MHIYTVSSQERAGTDVMLMSYKATEIMTDLIASRTGRMYGPASAPEVGTCKHDPTIDIEGMPNGNQLVSCN